MDLKDTFLKAIKVIRLDNRSNSTAEAVLVDENLLEHLLTIMPIDSKYKKHVPFSSQIISRQSPSQNPIS